MIAQKYDFNSFITAMVEYFHAKITHALLVGE